MALRIDSMRRIIRDNGHLVLTGDESREDLETAILNLFTEVNCRTEPGIRIDKLTSITAVKVEERARKQRETITLDL